MLLFWSEYMYAGEVVCGSWCLRCIIARSRGGTTERLILVVAGVPQGRSPMKVVISIEILRRRVRKT